MQPRLRQFAGMMVGMCLAAGVARGQDASELGKSLTPLGAIRAGNAKGTIPPYQGGIASPPAGFVLGQFHQDPFAAEQPLAVITAANMAQFDQELTEGTKGMLARYPTYSIRLFPTHRTAAVPAAIEAATIANVSTARLTPDGNGVSGAHIGIPFPIPKNGLEAIFNHRMRYHGSAAHYIESQVTPTQTGDFVPVGIEVKVLFAYNQGIAVEGMMNYFYEAVTSPPRLAGELVLAYETLDQVAHPRQVWTYNPGQRRVRRAPNVGYDSPGIAADGLATNDELDVFNGAPDRYDWKLIGRQEKIVPYNDYDLVSDKYKYTDLVRPLHINPALPRFELHRVWVVEATVKPGESHLYARRVFYIDEDSWNAVAADIYDQRGQLWRVDLAYGLQFWEVPVFTALLVGTYDLQSGRYFLFGLTNETRPPDFSVRYTAEDFSIDMLRNAGVR